MVKDDHPPILPPGVHQMTLGDLRGMAAMPSHDQRRIALQQGLELFVAAVLRLLPSAELFVDGSYLTTKEEPDDIDVVIFIDRQMLNAMSTADYDELDRLTQRDFARALYGLDLYAEPLGDMHRRAYWRGLFGFHMTK